MRTKIAIPQNKTTDSVQRFLHPSLERVLERFRLRAKRRTAWLRKLWSEEEPPGGKFAVTHGEIDTHLEGRDAPHAEAAWMASDASVLKLNDDLTRLEAEMIADTDSRLASLRRIFQLDDAEFDLFQGCLAVALDPSLARVCAYLQDHSGRAYMTEYLAARLYNRSGRSLWRPQSSLKRWELVMETEAGPGEPRILACDSSIRDWLLGDDLRDPLLTGISEIICPHPPLRNWPVDKTAKFVNGVLKGKQLGGVKIHIMGHQSTGRRTLASAISLRLGLPLLAIDTDHIAEEKWGQTFMRAQRQAFLEGCALAWHGEKIHRHHPPGMVRPFPVQFVLMEKSGDTAPVSGFIDYKIQMPVPGQAERRELWRRLVPDSETLDKSKFDELIDRHRLSVGQIANIGRRGLDDIEQAGKLAREVGRHRLGKLAQLLECPFTWDDLVVPDYLNQSLKDLTFEAKIRAAFWERPEARRLFPQGRGLLALFSGTPGTGKTMAAQVIAAELKLDLFRIDLSTVVSKYVGETSQNLEKILSRAMDMDVVLLFDEADALFGKRTEIRDAHDRFANTDTGYLLQAIENYQGIVLLTTNKKGNIDPGFIRRIRYVFEFPKPDAGQRTHIWQRVVSELVSRKEFNAVSDDLKRLGNSLDTTGAQIKFAVLAAIFAAQQDGRKLKIGHLLRGLDHEFAKEGRALSDRERERLLGHG